MIGGGRSPDRTGLHSQIPDKWENKWEFFVNKVSFQKSNSFRRANSVTCTEIPDATELGIYFAISGNSLAEAQKLGIPRDTPEMPISGFLSRFSEVQNDYKHGPYAR